MVRLGIDAENFARDRRGMGRVARAIARAALDSGDFGVTFLLRHRRDERALRAAFAERTIAVASAGLAARARHFDVVWFPWNGMRFGSRPPSLLTINDAFAVSEPHPSSVARRREQSPIRRGARDATRIVTCSAWSRSEICAALAIEPERTVVIPYAPDPFFFPGGNDALMGAWRYLLVVGARERRKNLRVVVEACAQALVGPRALLAIVGDVAPADRALLARLRVPHRLLGDVDDATLRTLYRNARGVAVPSTGEGFGLVAVEAMACGTATLAADASALPETCAGGALLIDPHDVAAWRDAIRSVVDDDAFATALAARGAARFAFASRSAPGAAYLALLRTLAAR